MQRPCKTRFTGKYKDLSDVPIVFAIVISDSAIGPVYIRSPSSSATSSRNRPKASGSRIVSAASGGRMR